MTKQQVSIKQVRPLNKAIKEGVRITVTAHPLLVTRAHRFRSRKGIVEARVIVKGHMHWRPVSRVSL